MAQEAGLADKNGRRIALKSVHIEGQVDGLLASMAITQHYHNNTGKTLEIAYTFPLAHDAVLLGMDVVLGDKRLHSVVIEKKEAWVQYEQAIDAGSTPVLLEQSGLNVCTVNLGNIAPDATVTIKLRYAQFLCAEDGIFSLRVPCVIAPRYGDQHKNGGLSPHETTAVDILARYPLHIRMTLLGQTAKADVVSLSHPCDISKSQEATVIALRSGAMLDRDFVFSLQGLGGHSFALLAPDENKHMMLASFYPEFLRKREPVRLKILVDRSGFMLGDSLASAKRILRCLLGMLADGDYVSLSCFGYSTQHENTTMHPYSPEILVHFGSVIESLQCDMGGASMLDALLSTCNNIAMPQGDTSSPSVLLISNGAVWNVEEVIQAGMDSGHRIFTIGVGSAPNEGLLQALAAKTGGTCMFLAPAGNASESIEPMLRKVFSPCATALKVSWGDEPEWQSPLPMSLYAKDAVHIFALFATPPTQPPVLHWSMNGIEQQLCAETICKRTDNAIARMGGLRRMAEASTPEQSLALSVKYQLVNEHSAMFLAHGQKGGKSGKWLELHQVPQMMAAGHGGFGNVRLPSEMAQSLCVHETLPNSEIASWQMLDDEREDEFTLLSIATSDHDEQVRINAAQKLCAMGSIATFIKTRLIVPGEAYNPDDERNFQLLEALVESIRDEAVLCDIVMHGDFGPGAWEDEIAPWLYARHRKSCEIRTIAASRIRSQELLFQIIFNRAKVPEDAVSHAMEHLTDRLLLVKIMHNTQYGNDFWVLRAAEKLKEDDFLAAIARDIQESDDGRLCAAKMVSNAKLRQTLLLEFSESPLPEGKAGDGYHRLEAVRNIANEHTRRRLYEAIARNKAYAFEFRFRANGEAGKLGGTSFVDELCDEIFNAKNFQWYDTACRIRYNGHHWKYVGVWQEGYGHPQSKYECTLCGAIEIGSDPRSGDSNTIRACHT